MLRLTPVKPYFLHRNDAPAPVRERPDTRPKPPSRINPEPPIEPDIAPCPAKEPDDDDGFGPNVPLIPCFA